MCKYGVGINTGIYSVWSGYKLIASDNFDPIASTLQDRRMNFNYKALRAIQIPPKIKITCWRLLRNFIPIMDNFYNLRIASSPLCPRCHLCPDS
ncbi:hypothetical protein PVK06_034367 [Gossypium arboreum]|uniref:Reverse transcriptase zinc-binding domain-containing protein n=1 Tax=Gossypium arboreum TaxID=29729 RepID=A0ABR0NE03_GOSAR|nr:hypothetical protein PVK06_034367 [Gossypium arboreum]